MSDDVIKGTTLEVARTGYKSSTENWGLPTVSKNPPEYAED